MNNASKQNVIQFLERCIVYADESIQRKKERGEEEEEISRWIAYRDFTAYASEEVSRGELDDWFDSEEEISLELGSEVMDLEEMTHEERSRWLSAIISPRPLVLVSTISSNGEPNLAPMSSVSVISNTPPLIGMSLSSNREGRPRDTLLNLKETRKATLAILPSNKECAQIIENTASPLPRDESEWGGIEALTTINDEVTAPKIAIAAIETTLVECHPLPLGSVAEWVILSVDSIIKPSLSNIENIESSSILAQIANNLLGGHQSTSWNQKIQDYQSN